MKTIMNKQLIVRYLFLVTLSMMIFVNEAIAQRNSPATSTRNNTGLTSPRTHATPVVIPKSSSNMTQHHDDRNKDWAYNEGYWVNRQNTLQVARYVYKQFVLVESRRRDVELEIRTYIRQKNQQRNHTQTVKFKIEKIALYRNGRFLGEVDKIPSRFNEIEATIQRNGNVRFESMVYLVGDPREGFELVVTDYNRNYLVPNFRNRRNVKIGMLDFRTERVREVNYSHFLGGGYDDFVMIPLAPENDEWGLGYTLGHDGNNRYQRGDGRFTQGLTNSTSRNNGLSLQLQRAPRVSNQPFYAHKEEVLKAGSGQDVRLKRRVEIETMEE